ncbi:MAG: ABC transporter permease subunit, partial [Candidatus Scatosoma sp.]
YNMIIIQNFFKGIPEELHESCMLDGAGELRILFSIYMPLSKPVLATVALWIAVGHWNSFFETMMYTSKTQLQTLQYYLLKVIKESSYVTSGVTLPTQAIEKLSPETVSFAAIVVSVIPMVVVYPFVMKYFESGIMIGSLKG